MLAVGWALPARADSMLEQLWAGYERIESVRGEIRRDNTGPGGTVRTLSRVYYQRPDRLNVENVMPVQRRIVADGERFYSYIQGDPKGFSRPIAELNEDMLINLRKVPGTGMEHLARLRGAAEEVLDAADGFPVRRGYEAGRIYAVLSFDEQGRWTRLELFPAEDRAHPSASYDYSDFQEVLSGVWIPLRQKGVFHVQGVESTEEVRVEALQVNVTLDPALFEASDYFSGITFVDSFDKIAP